MNYEVNTKPSKSGKASVYFITVKGKRLSKVNYRRKWEAEAEFKRLLKHFGEKKIMEWVDK